MYSHIYIYTYACIIYVHIRVYIYTYNTCVYAYIYILHDLTGQSPENYASMVRVSVDAGFSVVTNRSWGLADGLLGFST